MTTDQGPSTKAERQAAALSRVGSAPIERPVVPSTPSAASYFSTSRGTAAPQVRHTHVLPQTRVPEDLARDVAIYGNRHELSYSETVRVLLRLGLMRDETHDND
jgi:hypothetical protein